MALQAWDKLISLVTSALSTTFGVTIKDGSGDSAMDNANDAVRVSLVSGVSSTQYTEGDVDSTITGTAVMWEDTSDTLRAVSAAKPLPSTITNLSTVDSNAGSASDNTIRVVIVDDQTAVPTTPAGNVAHDAVDSGNPIKVGGKATASLSGGTNVAAADRSNLVTALDGSLLVRGVCLEDLVTGNASNTDGTSTQCIAAQAAGVKTYLTDIILANSSATATTVDIKDGTTIKLTIPVPANGGATVNLSSPIAGTAATAWNFDNQGTTTTLYCTMSGFKSKL
jgi:hypothetical protein